MAPNTDTDSNTEPRTDRTYNYLEFEGDDGVVAVIQDVEQYTAWIQSTLSVPVER
ncbi:hypothetical protein [Halogeometricum limi]|uniref:Uncharacterized protein n=1 Tax=Halogeometricum limi TaxID=555875 RepID=A0A1I6FQD2_9EURY|nr:hypothetical protein [Halogeometricum limi]SFR32153.1 hypothetical protein SAMN04488124_0071 [Halogeometricum limi]